MSVNPLSIASSSASFSASALSDQMHIALRQAAIRNDIQPLLKLLATASSEEINQSKAICYAAMHGEFEAVEALVAQGADVNVTIPDRQYNNLLHIEEKSALLLLLSRNSNSKDDVNRIGCMLIKAGATINTYQNFYFKSFNPFNVCH